MPAVGLGQRRALAQDRRGAEPRAGAAEHGEHPENPPFEAGRASAGITLGGQRVAPFAPRTATLPGRWGERRRMVEDWQARARAWRARRAAIRDEPRWTALSEFKAGITGRKGEGAVARELKRLTAAALHDVILEDDRGLTQIDHLVRSPAGVLVLETKTLGGRISGTPLCSSWTQHLGAGELERRTAFQNPLWQNLRHVRAVEAIVAALDVPVIGKRCSEAL